MSDREPKNWQSWLKVERPYQIPFSDIMEDPEHPGTFSSFRIKPERRVGIMRHILRKMIPCYSNSEDMYLCNGQLPLKKDMTGDLEELERGGTSALNGSRRKNTMNRRDADQLLKESHDQKKEEKEVCERENRKRSNGKKKSSLRASPTSVGGKSTPRKLKGGRNGKYQKVGRISQQHVPTITVPRDQWRPLPPLPWEVKTKSKTTPQQDSSVNKSQTCEGDQEKRGEIWSPKDPPTFARFKRRCENRFRLQDIREHQMKMRFILRDKAKERRTATLANKATTECEGLESQAGGETQRVANMHPNRSQCFTKPRSEAVAEAAPKSPALHQIVQTITQSERETSTRLEQLELSMCKQHEMLITISKLLSQGNAQNRLSEEYGIQIPALSQPSAADKVTGTACSSELPTSTRKKNRTRTRDQSSHSSGVSSSSFSCTVSSSENSHSSGKTPYLVTKPPAATPSQNDEALANITKTSNKKPSDMSDECSHGESLGQQLKSSSVADHRRHEKYALQRNNTAAKTTRHRQMEKLHTVEMSSRTGDLAYESLTSTVQVPSESSDINSDLSFHHKPLKERSHQQEGGQEKRYQTGNSSKKTPSDVSFSSGARVVLCEIASSISSSEDNEEPGVKSESRRLSRQTNTRSEDENPHNGSEGEFEKTNTSVKKSAGGTSTTRAGKRNKKRWRSNPQPSTGEAPSRKDSSIDDTLTEAGDVQTSTRARRPRAEVVTSTNMCKIHLAETTFPVIEVGSISDREREANKMQKSSTVSSPSKGEKDFILTEEGFPPTGPVKKEKKHMGEGRKRGKKPKYKATMPHLEDSSDSVESATPSIDQEGGCGTPNEILKETKNQRHKEKKANKQSKASTSEDDNSPPNMFASVTQTKPEITFASAAEAADISSLSEKSSGDDCSDGIDTFQPMHLPVEIASLSLQTGSIRKERKLKKKEPLNWNDGDASVASKPFQTGVYSSRNGEVRTQDSAEIRKNTIETKTKARKSSISSELKMTTGDLSLTADSAGINRGGITCIPAREERCRNRQSKKAERSPSHSLTKNEDEVVAGANRTLPLACEEKLNTSKILKKKKCNKTNQIVKKCERLADDKNTAICVQQIHHEVDALTEGENKVTRCRHSPKLRDKAERHNTLGASKSQHANILEQDDDAKDGVSELETAESREVFDLIENMHPSHKDKDENVNTEHVSDDLEREGSLNVETKTERETKPIKMTSSSEETKAEGSVKPKGKKSHKKRKAPQAWKKFKKEQGLYRRKKKQQPLSSKSMDISKDIEMRTDVETDSHDVTPPFQHSKQAAISNEVMNNTGETKSIDDEKGLPLEKQREQNIKEEEEYCETKEEESSDDAVKEDNKKPHKKRRAQKAWKKLKKEQGLYRRKKKPKQTISPDGKELATGDDIQTQNDGTCRNKRSHRKRKTARVWKKIKKEQGIYRRKKKPKQPTSPNDTAGNLTSADGIPHVDEFTRENGDACKSREFNQTRRTPKMWKKIKKEQGLYRRKKRPKHPTSCTDTALIRGGDCAFAKSDDKCNSNISHKKRKTPKVWKKVKKEQGLFRKKKPKQPRSCTDKTLATGGEITHVDEFTQNNGDTCKGKKPHKKRRAPKIWKEFKKEQGLYRRKKKQKQPTSPDTMRYELTGNGRQHDELAQKNDVINRELLSSTENGGVRDLEEKKQSNENGKRGGNGNTERVLVCDTAINDSKLTPKSSKTQSLWKTFKKEQGLFRKPKKHVGCAEDGKDILAETKMQKKKTKKEQKKQEEKARKTKKRLVKGTDEEEQIHDDESTPDSKKNKKMGLGKLLKGMKGRKKQKLQIDPQSSHGKAIPPRPAFEPRSIKTETSLTMYSTSGRSTVALSSDDVSDDKTAVQGTSEGMSNIRDGHLTDSCAEAMATDRTTGWCEVKSHVHKHQENKHIESTSSSPGYDKTLSTSETKEHQDDKMTSQRLTINQKSLISDGDSKFNATQPQQDQRSQIMHQILQELSSPEDSSFQPHKAPNNFQGGAESKVGIPTEGSPKQNLPEDQPKIVQDEGTISSSDDVLEDQIITHLPSSASKHSRGTHLSDTHSENKAIIKEKDVSAHHHPSAEFETREQSVIGIASTTKQFPLTDPDIQEAEDCISWDDDDEESNEEVVDQRTQEKSSKGYTSFEIEMMDELLSEFCPSGEEPIKARQVASQKERKVSSGGDPTSEKGRRSAGNKLETHGNQISNIQQSSQKHTSLSSYKIAGNDSKFPAPTSNVIARDCVDNQVGSDDTTKADVQSWLAELSPPQAMPDHTLSQALESSSETVIVSSATSFDLEEDTVETIMENINKTQTFLDGCTLDRPKASSIQAGKPGSISAFHECEIPHYLRENFNPASEQKTLKRWDPMTAKKKLGKISNSKKTIPEAPAPRWLKSDFNPDGSAPKREAWNMSKKLDLLCSTHTEVSVFESDIDHASMTPEAREKGMRQIENESRKILNSMKSQENFQTFPKTAKIQMNSTPSSADKELPRYLRADFDPAAPDQTPFKRWNPDDAKKKLTKMSSNNKLSDKFKKRSNTSALSLAETPRWLQLDFHPGAEAPTGTSPSVSKPAWATNVHQSKSRVEAIGSSNDPMLAHGIDKPGNDPADHSVSPATATGSSSTKPPNWMKPGFGSTRTAWQDTVNERRLLLNSIAKKQAAATRPRMMSN